MDATELRRRELVSRQMEIYGDIELLRTQAAELPEVWTGLEGDGADVVVLLTEPEDYEQRLRALVEHPDRLHFRRSRYTRVQLDEVHRQAIKLLDDGSMRSHGPGLERVHITLRSNRMAQAEQLHQKFGDAIEITLGQHRFPLETAEVLPAEPAPESTIQLPHVVTTVLPDAPTFATGEDIDGQVLIENRGTTPLVVQTGVIAFGVLLDEHGNVVGHWNGIVQLPGQSTPVAPGSQITHRFIAGSDTSDPQLGASLPPGTYNLVVSIHIGDESTLPHPDTLVTKPIPLELTA